MPGKKRLLFYKKEAKIFDYGHAACAEQISGLLFRISMNLFIVGDRRPRGRAIRGEALFSARGSRAMPARAEALLMRLGTSNELRDDDRLDAADEVA